MPRAEGVEIGIRGRVLWRAVLVGGELCWLWVGA